MSLILLPRPIREPISLAFLACKAADTIADTDLIPRQDRLKILDAYRELFATQGDGFAKDIADAVKQPAGGSPAEKKLIENLPALMEALAKLPPADWSLIQELVLELTQGMQMDLGLTEGLKTEQALEQYTYYVAGCVGRFWTRMVKQHFGFAENWGPDVEDLGEKIGKGLQLVNILRDLPRDLEKGRRYIPQGLLRNRRVLTGRARECLNAYRPYCDFYPWYACRLKAVVRLPVRLGFKTLELLENAGDWLSPAKIHKVSRRQVYQTLLSSLLR
ncbi:MAG: squalene/phytoene synthase family protein [Deltaproteobacteria bacterium]|nr:squalene/phytoene synthase family protein [Deltaproteobacteria bacterium]